MPQDELIKIQLHREKPVDPNHQFEFHLTRDWPKPEQRNFCGEYFLNTVSLP